jgi:hypothetical protein
MLSVPTLLVASPVPVTRDTLEMGSHVWVCGIIQALQYFNAYNSQILMRVLLVLTTVTLMLLVPTLLVASPVPVTKDTLEVVPHVQVHELLCFL